MTGQPDAQASFPTLDREQGLFAEAMSTASTDISRRPEGTDDPEKQTHCSTLWLMRIKITICSRHGSHASRCRLRRQGIAATSFEAALTIFGKWGTKIVSPPYNNQRN
jgi:hypothetical protein